MRIIVSDSSTLTELLRAGVLFEVLSMPFSIGVPHVVIDGNLACIPPAAKSTLLLRGLAVLELDGAGMRRVQDDFRRYPALEFSHGMALEIAREAVRATVICNDEYFHSVALKEGVDCRGSIWVVDVLEQHGVCLRTNGRTESLAN